jgi:hypothetical protein
MAEEVEWFVGIDWASQRHQARTNRAISESSDRLLTLQHQAVKVPSLAHIVIWVSLVDDAAIVPDRQ